MSGARLRAEAAPWSVDGVPHPGSDAHPDQPRPRAPHLLLPDQGSLGLWHLSEPLPRQHLVGDESGRAVAAPARRRR